MKCCKLRLRNLASRSISRDFSILTDGCMVLRSAMRFPFALFMGKETAPVLKWLMMGEEMCNRGTVEGWVLATTPVKGTKKSKDHITIGLCSNAYGSEKLKPIVVAKAARPRCFPKKFNVQCLVHYIQNKCAVSCTLYSE